MYEKGKVVSLSETVGLMSKNLQVVSFDSSWHEIYIGTVRRDRFIAVCPNQARHFRDVILVARIRQQS